MAHDFDLFVIGAGSGGVRAARIAASFGARVGIADPGPLGGTCVNLGCVPKKMFVYAASYADDFDHAEHYGWSTEGVAFDWPTLLTNKNAEIARLNGVYARLLQEAGAQLFRSKARIVDPHTVELGDRRVTAKNILIATGSMPNVPELPGAEFGITSDDAFHLPQLPKRMIVAGGGYIAVEFASIFRGLGVETTLLYRGELFLREFDVDLRTHLRDQLRLKGITLCFESDIERVKRQPSGELDVHLDDGRVLHTDGLMFAVGRKPRLDGLGLENTHVQQDDEGNIKVDDEYRTAEPSIRAVGDIIGRVQLTPVALAEGTAVARLLFKPELYRALDYDHIPTAIFSLPNIGTVGLSEEKAKKEGYEVRVFETRFKSLKLMLTGSHERTYLKLVVDAKTDRVIGCHMVGPDAGEVIQGLAIAIRAGATKKLFDETLGVHPTTAEEFVTLREER